jgi:uracil-DNA glycosylase family 4
LSAGYEWFLVEFVADRDRNPFDMKPACERYVPGYGASDADFHVVGDHPGVHGGLSTGIPFTDTPWSERFFDALVEAEFLAAADLAEGRVNSYLTYFSYLHMCEPDGDAPSAESYAELEPFFDAELRAITAHVLLPVGPVATEHVLSEYTPLDAGRAAEMDALHGRELRGSGWLVCPIKEPAEWTEADEAELVDALTAVRTSDYRQISDLGRFLADDDPYFVR